MSEARASNSIFYVVAGGTVAGVLVGRFWFEAEKIAKWFWNNAEIILYWLGTGV